MAYTRILHMISGPRNLSTAMMYAFAQRKDTKVIDEPFYAHYLLSTGIDHPGREDTIKSMPHDPDHIQKSFFEFDKKPFLYLKDMAHHLIDMDLGFLAKVENIFLIRNPYQLIASFTRVIKEPTMQDIGLEDEWRLFELMQTMGQTPVVLDTGDLLAIPEAMMEKFCAAISIPFDSNMLHWPKGGIPEDGVWARYWYKSLHESTGFSKRPTSTRPMPDQYQPLYEKAMVYYEKLSQFKIHI